MNFLKTNFLRGDHFLDGISSAAPTPVFRLVRNTFRFSLGQSVGGWLIVSDFPSLSAVVAAVWTQVDPNGPKWTQVDTCGHK